ncbi:MAG: oligoendopeptidase [Oceanotoga sp.]|jgi:oligoendopeptidase F|uniref:Oligoendopeptidase F n=1 Tax=Oceanotoga teriensis TaxID=515440 RepID=A0AA45HI34_9BACT|nr:MULTISPECIES: M3 family oligoendopeptidase [Oceanotoga]MDN5341721.1 oligoendopeptidase [Oceanotoga sp.]PWJ89300.1 oligoendopeptidase F [Oceanotoga teriensis]
MYTNEKVEPRERKYYDESFKIKTLEDLKNEYKKLENMNLNEEKEVIKFIEIKDELESIISEEMAWKYIKMSCNADKPEIQQEFNRFYSQVIAPSASYDFKLKKQLYDSKGFKQLDHKYDHLKNLISNSINIFREKNIELNAKEQEISSKYGEIISKIIINFDGEEKTLSQMGIYSKNPDRSIREKAFMKSSKAIIEKEAEIQEVFDQLLKLRINMAKNADYDNYRDYMHKAKARFDYTPEDLFEFHESVEKEVIPFLKELSEERKQKLEIESLRPWDMNVDLDGKILKPFKNNEEFVEKAIKILYKVDPQYGKKLEMMKNSGHLDLENRKGKAPGGYSYPLSESGGSFIFMNAIGLNNDVRTLLHESGHAMHAFAAQDIRISEYRDVPSEVAELASMSMELLTLDYLSEYYDENNDLKKAKRDQLEGTLKTLPWVMIIDAFQHWIYTNPNHTVQERNEYFASLVDRFDEGIDWSDLEKEKQIKWMRQLHVFEVPFYYIEYAMSQLGAIAIYKNYKENGKSAIKMYDDFLKLGYSKGIKDIYETAGIKFDFSRDYVKSLVEFIKGELSNI